jgi:ribosome maturation factor RimP
VEQCAEISRLVGLALEVEEIFGGAWVLEVSSPGLERAFFRLEQMTPYVGREVEVNLWEAHGDFPGRRKFRGVLRAVGKESVALRLAGTPAVPVEAVPEGRDVVFPWRSVRKVRLVHIFPDTGRMGAGKAAGKSGGKKA